MNPFDDKDLHDLLRLSSVAGIGSQRIRNLIARFKSPAAVLHASVRELVGVEGIDKALARNIKTGANAGFADQQLKLLHKYNANIVTFWDELYPPLLKKTADPPALLYVRGQLLPGEHRMLAMVGTRSPSSYGKLMAERFARELQRRDITIVSGLARGIDTISHRATLAAGGRTIAVLGTGVDVVYPSENKELAKKICDNGALVSEFPMGAGPDAPHFPRRNRIIAGMCLGTLVVEAGLNSGALITTDFALEQGREVFAIPGNINNPKCYGCNRLIQQGAKLVQTIDDILEELQIDLTQYGQEAKKPNVPLSKIEEKIIQFLSHEPVHIDALAQKADMSTAQVLGVLLTLELKNLVRQVAGKNFVRA